MSQTHLGALVVNFPFQNQMRPAKSGQIRVSPV